MKLHLFHLPSKTTFISDEINDFTHEEVFELVKEAASLKLSYFQITCEGNEMFIPEKILAESVITIIKD